MLTAETDQPGKDPAIDNDGSKSYYLLNAYSKAQIGTMLYRKKITQTGKGKCSIQNTCNYTIPCPLSISSSVHDGS